MTPVPARVAAAHPAMAAAWDAYVHGVFTHPALPAGTLDLCLVRIAGLLGDADGGPGPVAPAPADLTDRVAALPAWTTDPRIGPVDRACLALAEQFVLDAQALDDATTEAVRAVVGDRGLAVLVIGVGLAEGLVRAGLALGDGGTGPFA